MSPPKRVVYITGITGIVGRALVDGLKEEYILKGASRRGTPVEGAEVFKGDVADRDFIRGQFQGVDTLIHLGADPSTRAEWDSVLRSNIIGCYEVYEAARLAGVRRIIFASTNHVTGVYTEQLRDMTPDDPVRPDSLYGVSKAFGEALGRFYSDCHGMSVLDFRIGWLPHRMEEEEMVRYLIRLSGWNGLTMWLSARDCVAAHRAGIEAPDALRHGCYYIMSNNYGMLWDLSNARRDLNWEPKDDLRELFRKHGVPYNLHLSKRVSGG
ncbi:MAG: NAD(P)-dependent oxidoreductase [Candidatus Sumerlaeota bacterium]|nr:NAD(P)-dependent oxidoreductase [Candidatus Sumerlaeota bacterium]